MSFVISWCSLVALLFIVAVVTKQSIDTMYLMYLSHSVKEEALSISVFAASVGCDRRRSDVMSMLVVEAEESVSQSSFSTASATTSEMPK